MDVEPAPYQHRNISQFVPNNHNIGLTDEQLVTISTKEFNKLLKTSGRLFVLYSQKSKQRSRYKWPILFKHEQILIRLIN